MRLVLILCSCFCVTLASAALRLDCYQHADKALSVHAGGDFVDPYFANRALITAHELGMNIESAARDWIEWSLAQQLADGRFARYCRQGEQHWQACAEADADDAVLAIWQQLLYLISAEQTQHGAWRDSAQRAQAQLARLFDRERGIYLVSRTQRFGLFMDNVEIYAALKTIATQQQTLAAPILAQTTAAQADRLQHAINRVFWRNATGTYAVSTKQSEEAAFYPQIVAQVYPWLFALPTPVNTQQAYAHWLSRHAKAWLSFSRDKYPWGLVAATADKLGDSGTAKRWLQQAAALRDTQRWNILEEAIYQALADKYAIAYQVNCQRAGP